MAEKGFTRHFVANICAHAAHQEKCDVELRHVRYRSEQMDYQTKMDKCRLLRERLECLQIILLSPLQIFATILVLCFLFDAFHSVPGAFGLIKDRPVPLIAMCIQRFGATAYVLERMHYVICEYLIPGVIGEILVNKNTC